MSLIDGTFHLFVEDNGCGFNPEEIEDDGHGVENIKERAAQINGSASLQTKKGEGTRWEVEVRLK